jgi:2-hydroxychromene-2-carboxylate isomerase
MSRPCGWRTWRAPRHPDRVEPFLLGHIFRRQGWNDSPFNLNPARGRYMWRDVRAPVREARHSVPQATQFPRARCSRRRRLHRAGRAVASRVRTSGLPRDFVEDRDIASADLLEHPARARPDDRRSRPGPGAREQGNACARGPTPRGRSGSSAPTFEVSGEIFWGTTGSRTRSPGTRRRRGSS